MEAPEDKSLVRACTTSRDREALRREVLGEVRIASTSIRRLSIGALISHRVGESPRLDTIGYLLIYVVRPEEGVGYCGDPVEGHCPLHIVAEGHQEE